MTKRKKEQIDEDSWTGMIFWLIILCLIVGCNYKCKRDDAVKEKARIARIPSDMMAYKQGLAEMKEEADLRDGMIQKEINFYGYPHKLRKMFEKNKLVSESTPAKGNFFLFTGDYTGGTENRYVVNQVKFAWEIEKGMYMIKTLLTDNIRIKLVKNKKIPTISYVLSTPSKIRWEKDYGTAGLASVHCFSDEDIAVFRDHMNPDRAIDGNLDYAIITVSEEDWPTDVSPPMTSKDVPQE